MDVNVLASKLENQPDKIIQILEALGFENIKFNPLKNNLRFAREEQRNPTSCMLDCGTLRFFVFSTNQKGKGWHLRRRGQHQNALAVRWILFKTDA